MKRLICLSLSILLLAGCAVPPEQSPSEVAGQIEPMPPVTPEPMAAPTAAPATPTPAPSAKPTARPSPTPSAAPDASPSPEASPTPAPEPWFLGDWVGYYGYMPEDGEPYTDFSVALEEFHSRMLLFLRFYEEEDGSYSVQFDDSHWTVRSYTETTVDLHCEGDAPYASNYMIDASLDASENLNMHLRFIGRVTPRVPGHQVPVEGILAGSIVADSDSEFAVLLAHLPPAEERDAASGKFPRWRDEYHDMVGATEGIFHLLTTASGTEYFGTLSHEEDGGHHLTYDTDGSDRQDPWLAPRDGRSEDITNFVPKEFITGAYWPIFRRASYASQRINGGWDFYTDVSPDHASYYRNTYIPTLRAQIEALEGEEQTLWVQNGILVREALIEAAKAIGRHRGEEEFDPDAYLAKPEYLPAISLAGLTPGDTLEDAMRLHDLRPLAEETARVQGLSWNSGHPRRYWDGNGLFLTTLADGRIDAVCIEQPGYALPGIEDIGDPYDPLKFEFLCRDGILRMEDRTPQYGAGSTGRITRITLDMIYEREWATTYHDLNDDGLRERLTLSARGTSDRLERATVHGYSSVGALEGDYGTEIVLRVYEGAALVREEVLPVAHRGYPLHFMSGLPEAGAVHVIAPTYGETSYAGDWLYRVLIGEEIEIEFLGYTIVPE